MECESDRYTNHDVWSMRVTTLVTKMYVRVTATLTMMYVECKSDGYSTHDVWSVSVIATLIMMYRV